MKILFVTHGPDMMGANRSMLNLIAGLETYGVDCVILTPEEGKLMSNVKDKQEVIVSSYYRWAHTKYISKEYWINAFLQRKNKQKLEEIAQKVEAYKFDIIYSNSSTVGIGAQLADKLNIAHVWRIREFGEEDYGLSYWKGRNHFFEWANKAAAISFISKAIQAKFENKITVPKYCIYNGVISKKDLDAVVLTKNKKEAPFTFLIIGLIHPNKGQFEAVKGFHELYKQHPNSRLIIVGKGRRLYTKSIKNYIKNNKLENCIDFLGYIDNPKQIYQEIDCLLMCSKSEGMGRVTVEAMIFGKPIIGFDGGATPELVKHQKNGLLYANDKELCDSMKILVMDKEKAQSYGDVGREMAEEFVTEISVGKEYEVFQKIMEGKTNKN